MALEIHSSEIQFPKASWRSFPLEARPAPAWHFMSTCGNMRFTNISLVTNIHLLGFQGLHSFKTLVFLLLLIMFCATVCGNLLIIVVVSYSRSLHSPMYFFLTQLSFLDLLLTTTIVPVMLRVVLYEGSSVSFISCMIQYHLFLGAEALECLLLTVMSYDRYQAICNPLHYSSIMDFKFCLQIVLLCWLVVISMVVMFSVFFGHLWSCGPNIIDHFFCDFDPLLELSCSDTFMLKLVSILLVIPMVVCPMILIIISYVYIIITILKIPSVTRRHKTFYTCSSHLAVVSMLYASIISIYLFPDRGIQKLSTHEVARTTGNVQFDEFDVLCVVLNTELKLNFLC
ncbi:olfactory receptor 11L1-like [Dendropsophus ebraccatus]|uniref:olfactory receptor 11L1-like n=1 Tax=Dendropsophus ebraccatus TaxID=150705 RepID=UPI0038310AD8